MHKSTISVQQPYLQIDGTVDEKLVMKMQFTFTNNVNNTIFLSQNLEYLNPYPFWNILTGFIPLWLC